MAQHNPNQNSASAERTRSSTTEEEAMGAFSGQLFENVTCKACNIKTNAYAEDAEIKLENNESRIIQIRLDTHNSRMPRIECTKSQNIVNARVTYEFSGQGAYAVEVI